MAGTPGTFRFPEVAATPSAPPVGYALLYIKTDNVLYLQDSSAVEIALGSSSSITSLIGDVLATGPGSATATVAFVGGKSSSAISTSVTDTQNATSANTFNLIVKRDSSGDIFVTQVNGVTVETHASRHLPNGADPLTTAAPSSDLTANTSNSTGTANSLARSDHSHAIDTAAATTQTPDQSNAAGSSANLARADHVHNIPTAAPSTDLTANTSNSQGIANSFARSDHSHKIDTGTPISQSPDQTNDAGVSSNLAKSDHIHNIATDVPIQINANGSNNQGSSTKFSRADHKHDIATAVPVTQNTNQANNAGSSSNLARADHIHNIPTSAPSTQTPDQANSDGTSVNFSRADHIHNIPTDVAVGLSATTTNIDGSGVAFSKNDHTHAIASGPVSTQTPDNSNSTGSSSNFARADHIHDIPTAAPITDLNATTINAKGSAASFARSDHSHAIDTAAAITQTPDQANATGSSTNLARADHVHDIPTGVPSDIGSSNTQGSAAAFARQDHVHKGVHSINANGGTQEFGDLELANGSGISISDAGGVFTISSTGATSELITSIGSGLSINYTTGNVLINGTYTGIISGSVSVGPAIVNGWIYVNTSGVVSSGTVLPAGAIALAQFNSNATVVTVLHDRRTYLDQNIQYGTPITDLTAITTNAQGSLDAIARADHTHAIDTSAPVTQTPDQSNTTGSSANLARADHIHNIPTGVASGLDSTSTNTQGSAAAFARQDHTHNIASGTPSTQTPNQSNTTGSSVNFAKADHIHNIPTTAPIADLTASTTNADGSAASFSRSDHSHKIDTGVPSTQVPDQSNAIGSSANLARADHIHNIPSGVPVQIGISNTQGSASTFSLSDHIHSHGNQTNPSLHAVATPSANGFMSSTDKAKTDAELPSTLGTSNQVLGVNNAGTAGEYKSLVGTVNQVIITDAVGSKTFSTPQDINTTSQPTFAGENLTDRLQLTEQIAPSTPIATKIDIFAESSNGFTRLRSIDSTGIKSTILRDTLILVKNITGSTISAGKAVYYTGADSITNLPTIGLAQGNSSSTMPAIGLTIESIANNATGRVIALGIVGSIDTSAFSQGDKLYVSSTVAGGLTNTKPISPNNIWQRMGIVLISNALTGSIEVRPFATHGEESGTNTGYTFNSVALTDGANIATDVSKGNIFTVTLGGNRNLSAPTNPTDGQKITYRITQDATGGRGLTFDAIFNFGLDIISFTPSTGANKTDYVGCIYNGSTTKWDVVAVSKGF